MGTLRSLVCATVVLSGWPGLGAEQLDLGVSVDRAWSRLMALRDPVSGLIHTTDLSKALVPDDAKGNFYPYLKTRKPGGPYGPPTVGDQPLDHGTALSGLVDKWQATLSEAVRSDAAKIARGLLNLAILHGRRGFVCRGFCCDRKTTCSLSSRDQYTHWVHGLWRYVTSTMAESALVEDYRLRIAEVAEFMEARITPETGWNFGLGDDSGKDPRGICTMWGPDLSPHEAARLPMIYAAAHLATGNGRWRALYERYIDEALEKTLTIREKKPSSLFFTMPCYSFYQANVSLELLLAYEKDAVRRNRIVRALHVYADLARGRQEASETEIGKKFISMCLPGEVLLTQLMDPTFRADDAFRAYLSKSVRGMNPECSGMTQTAHMMAAYWRSRRLEQNGNPR